MCGHGFETGVDSYLFRQVCCSFSGTRQCSHGAIGALMVCAWGVELWGKWSDSLLSHWLMYILMRLFMYVGMCARALMHICVHTCVCVWVLGIRLRCVYRTPYWRMCAHARSACVCACVLVWCRKVDMSKLLKLDIHMYMWVCACVCILVCERMCLCMWMSVCLSMHELVIDELSVSHISTVLGDTSRVCHIAYSMCLW